MKIRTYLALMAGAVLVPVVLFSAFALDLLLKAEREAVLRSMHELARATVFAVEGEFSRSEGVVRALATSNALQTGDFATFYRQAVATNAGRGSNVSLVDENGDRLLTTVVPYGTPLPKLPEANRARAVSAFANAKPQISDLIYGPITGQYLAAVELVVPVADGRRYLISEWKYTSFFKALLPTRNVPKSWLIGVFDRAGVTVVRNAGPDEFIGKPPKDDLLAAIRSEGVDQIRNQSREGVELYTALARSPKAGWTVAVGVPVAEIEAAATRAVLVAGAGLLGAIVCALAAALLFGFRLTRSLDQAADSAATLREGKIPRSDNSGVTEVDQLLDSMRDTGVVLDAAKHERVALLSEAEQGRAEAEAQSHAKDEFLAMLGHELRNPLGAISAGIALLESGKASPDSTVRAKAIIARQCAHLTHLVDDLLDASRLVTGKVTLFKRQVDLAESARRSLATLAMKMGGTDSWRLEVRTEPAWVYADATRLEQMIGNLLENAFKYTPVGGAIDVCVGSEGGMAVLTVRDSGLGIGAQQLSRIFDMFVQVPRHKRLQSGLGIGLAVVRQLAQQHGAELQAESEGEGKGSTFVLRFPLVEERSGAHAMHAPTALDGSPVRAPRENGATIVVVDDNDDLRTMLAEALTSRGLDVREAINGNEGIRAIETHRPAIALVDIDMPDITGYEVVAHLRKTGSVNPKETMLVALTGFGQESDRKKALEAGFDAHLKKPLDIEELMRLLAH